MTRRRRKRRTVRRFGKLRTLPYSDPPFLFPPPGLRYWARNTKSPMPQLVISRSSTSATVVSPPPPTIIQAPMRILKRQTPTTTPSNTSASPSPTPQSLTERDAKYQEARERIFGSPKPSEQDSPKTGTPPPRPIPNVIRNPTGPETNTPGPNSNASQGFGGRRGGRS